MNKQEILSKIESMDSFIEKFEYLNRLFLKAKTEKDADMLLDMMEQLKMWIY